MRETQLFRIWKTTHARTKRIAAREQRTMSAIIDRAVLNYEQQARRELNARRRGRDMSDFAWPGDDDLDECSECGHLHFNPKQRTYTPCPLASEGCTCSLGKEGDAA